MRMSSQSVHRMKLGISPLSLKVSAAIDNVSNRKYRLLQKNEKSSTENTTVICLKLVQLITKGKRHP